MKMRKIIAFMCCVMIAVTISGFAYAYSGSSYTNDSALAAKLDNLFSGVKLFTNKSGKYGIGSNIYTYNKASYRWSDDGGGGSECYAYANAAYCYLFGESPLHGNRSYSYSKSISGVKGASSLSYATLSNAGVGCGAYIRTTNESSGNYNGNSGHSMIILTYSSSKITYIHASGSNRTIQITSESWNDFTKNQLSGKKRYVSHIIQPNSTYNQSEQPSEKEMSGIYQFNKNDDSRSGPGEAYSKVADKKKGDIVFVVASAVSSYGYTWYRTTEGSYVYSGDVDKITLTETTFTGTYAFTKDDESRSWPYEASVLVQSYKKGATVSVVAKVVNTYGNTWYRISDGSYVWSGDVEQTTVVITPTPTPAVAQPYDSYNTAYEGWYTVQKTSQYLSINTKPMSEGTSGSKTVFTSAKNGWYVHIVDAAAAAGTAKKWGWVNAAYNPSTQTWYNVYGYACMYYLKRNASQTNPIAISVSIVNSNPRQEDIVNPDIPSATATPIAEPTAAPTVAPTAVVTITATPAPVVHEDTSIPVGDYSVGNVEISIEADGSVVCNGVTDDVSTVTIPDEINVNGIAYTVTKIDDGAFYGSSKLKTVTIGKNIKVIGKNAFASCKKLTTVKGGAAVTTIQDNAFEGDSKLKTLPQFGKLKTIGSEAFKNCKVLAKITLSKNVSSIGKNAFYNCKKLKSITVKTKNLTNSNVKNGAFAGINSGATFICPSGMKSKYKKLFVKKGAPSTAKFK